MADIPGIIEGASDGKGLGHYFLRHIERNSLLLFVISSEHDISQRFNILLNELKMYNPELLSKDIVLAISKSDLISKKETEIIIKKIKMSVKNIPFVFISSISEKDLLNLKILSGKC